MFAPAAALSLTDGEKSQIEALLRNGSTPQKVALRGRIILLAKQGLANRAIAEQLNLSRPTVLAMRSAFAQNGLEAITGVRKRKRKAKVLTAELEGRIVETTLKSRPGDGSTHWSVRTLAGKLGVSRTIVHRVWQRNDIQPHRVERFKRFCRNRAVLLFFGLTARSLRAMRQTLNPAVAKVLKRLHFPLDVILLCVRWYSAYPLSLRHLEEMMAERGISVDHSTVHRWAIKLLPVLDKAFRRSRRKVGKSWRMDETYIKVKGEWKYLYRAVDKAGDTVDFLLRARRDKAAACRFFEQAIERNDAPEKIAIDKSGSNVAALEAMNVGRGTPIVVRQVKYLNNIVEQDHRAIKRRTRPMLGFKKFRCARILLSGIELMHMIRKGQMENGGSGRTPAQLFYSLAA